MDYSLYYITIIKKYFRGRNGKRKAERRSFDDLRILKIRNGLTLVDADDYEMLSQHSWYLDSEGYATHGVRLTKRIKGVLKKTTAHVRMHNFLLGYHFGLVGDHYNWNRLDNRRNNLRAVTQGDNVRNCDKSFWCIRQHVLEKERERYSLELADKKSFSKKRKEGAGHGR